MIFTLQAYYKLGIVLLYWLTGLRREPLFAYFWSELFKDNGQMSLLYLVPYSFLHLIVFFFDEK